MIVWLRLPIEFILSIEFAGGDSREAKVNMAENQT